MIRYRRSPLLRPGTCSVMVRLSHALNLFHRFFPKYTPDSKTNTTPIHDTMKPTSVVPVGAAAGSGGRSEGGAPPQPMTGQQIIEVWML
eukprot:COSAG01_NODE_1011_length_12147_cov_12.737384_11_plen_88_part_01